MSNSTKKIIIFDDDEDILSICSYILEEAGWDVYTFTDCNDVTDRVRRIMPDVILMDNWIPDTGGIIATQALKNDRELKTIPVIYFSANSEIGQLALIAGANSVLAKPFDLEELQNALKILLMDLSPFAGSYHF